jgi:hypothetical protein
VTIAGIQRRRLKRETEPEAVPPTSPVTKPLAIVMTGLTALTIAGIALLFSLGTLTSDRVAGALLIPATLLVITDTFMWGRLFDETHAMRHPVRFARARWQARATRPARPPAAGRLLRAQRRQHR